MNGSSKGLKLLIYDIETNLKPVLVFSLGEQVIRHNQMIKLDNDPGIICIAYAWLDKPGVHLLTWNPKTHSTKKMIAEFDKLVQEADIVIGKNNKKFDDKHVNTQRLLEGLPPVPDWVTKSEDLEQQMRRHFYMPSQSLDYISELLGFGGKSPMEFQDWKDIYEGGEKGEKAFIKMCKYCKHDVVITKKVLKRVLPYVKFKFNMATYLGELEACTMPTCGSKDIIKNGTRVEGTSIVQHYYCKTHGGYAGKRTKGVNDKLGKMRV